MNRTIEADFLPKVVEPIKEKVCILIIDKSHHFPHPAKLVPRNRVVYDWFDAHDLEEERL